MCREYSEYIELDCKNKYLTTSLFTWCQMQSALRCVVELSRVEGEQSRASLTDHFLIPPHRAPTLILVISIYHHHHHNRIFIVHNFTTNPGFANLLLEGIQHLAPNPAKLARYRLKRRRCKNRQQVALAGCLAPS